MFVRSQNAWGVSGFGWDDNATTGVAGEPEDPTPGVSIAPSDEVREETIWACARVQNKHQAPMLLNKPIH